MSKKTKKNAAQPVTQESGLLDALLSTSFDGIVITDVNQEIILANDTFCAFFGLALHEVIEADFFSLLGKLNPGAQQQWRELVEKTHRQGECRGAEFKIAVGKGIKFLRVNASLLDEFEGEEKIRILSTWQDVTEYKEAEHLTRKQRDLVHLLSSASNLDEALSLCVKSAISLSGMDSGGIYLVDSDSGDLSLAYSRGLSPGFVRSASFYKADTANTLLVKKGKPVYVHYNDLLPETKNQARQGEGLRFTAIVPVLHEGHVIASLNVASHTLETMPAAERNALETFALQVGGIITRLQVEKALRKEITRAQSYFDVAGVIIVAINSHQEVESINQKGCQVLGYSEEEIVGKNWFDCFLPADLKDQVKQVFSKMMKGEIEPVEYYENPVLTKKGEQRIIAWHNTVLKDEEGRITGTLSSGEDVTERKKAEAALRDSEERYRTLQDNIPVGIFRSSPRGKIMSANPAMYRMFGCASEDEMLAVPAAEFYVHPEDRLRLLELLQKNGIVTDFETLLKRKDGSTFWGSFNIKGVTDKQGQIVSHDGIMEDISERKKWAEAIVHAREEWERTFDSVPDMITILDKKHNIRRVNKALTDKLGITPEEAVGQPCYKVIHHTDFPPRYCPHIKMLKDGGEHTVEIHEAHLGLDLLITASPMYDHQGKLIGAVHAARDITERKKMDKELQKAEKLESLGLLAGGIAHDFNNILSSILVNIGMSKVYASKADKTLIRLNEAEKAVLRAKDLTQQLLTFSRGGAPIKNPASIAALLKDTAEFTLSGSNVRCDFSTAGDLWDVEIDEGQMSQVIQNLVLNASQAMPQGGTVYIGAKNVTLKSGDLSPLKEGRYIKIEMKDQGVGIPREHYTKIFDPFFSTKQKGSGLGLSTAYSIVKNHNGLLTLESELGKGTTFYIYLPATEKKAKKKKKADLKVVAGHGRILLMDDEEMVLDATGDMLQEMGYTVTTTQDGEEAIKLYETARQAGEPFDVVIMDLVIPGGMGGKETIEKLLKIDPAVRAVVSSGYSTDPVMANYAEYGFVGAVSKPYKILDMSAVLQAALGGKKPGRKKPRPGKKKPGRRSAKKAGGRGPVDR